MRPDYTYDANNRLLADTKTLSSGATETTQSGALTELVYRPDGLRHSKTTGGDTTTHVWDGGNIVLDETGGDVVKYNNGKRSITARREIGRLPGCPSRAPASVRTTAPNGFIFHKNGCALFLTRSRHG